MADDLRVTAWVNPDQMETGKYGRISNHEWLTKEKVRFENEGIKCRLSRVRDETDLGNVHVKEALFRLN